MFILIIRGIMLIRLLSDIAQYIFIWGAQVCIISLNSWSVRLVIKRRFNVSWYNMVQFYNARMTELKQIVELSVSSFRIDYVLIGVANFFNSKKLLGLFVFSLINQTVRAFTYLAEYFVCLIYMVIKIWGTF
jgi:hypothetical protein